VKSDFVSSRKAEVANNALRPIAAGERIDVLDVLRGFALFGVLVANVVWFFSGFGNLAPDDRALLSTAAFDPVVLELETFFVVNKFISIFSFLFGVGFALQMRHAGERGAGVRRLYVRRMLWLFLFGVAHAFFIWYGDILHLYAVLGILLIGCVSLDSRQLVWWGIAFAVFIPIAVKALLWGLPLVSGGAIDPAVGFEARWDAAATHHFAFAEGSYFQVIRANAADMWAWLSTDDALTTGLASFGKLLLGFWAGRTGILALASSSRGSADAHKAAVVLMRRGLVWGSFLGVVSQGILVADWVPMLGAESWGMRVARTALWQVGVLALAASYVCVIVLLFRRPSWRRRLAIFAPVGRMAFTNYLAQSVICVLIFYGLGLGLYGSVGPTASIGIAIVVFVAQAIFSAWWLRLFRFGPAEWVWRSLTYGQRQPFRTRLAV